MKGETHKGRQRPQLLAFLGDMKVYPVPDTTLEHGRRYLTLSSSSRSCRVLRLCPRHYRRTRVVVELEEKEYA